MAATDGEPIIEDGFPAVRLFNQGYSYTYDDVIFLPHYIDFPTDAVQLPTKLSRDINLSIPCIASPMDTVTESSMAVSMPALGGIGIIHSNNPPSLQASLIRSAKSHRIPFAHLEDLIFKSPSDSISFASEFDSCPNIFIIDTGSKHSKLLCVVSKFDRRDAHTDSRVCEYMEKSPLSMPSTYNFEDVARFLGAKQLDFVLLVDERDRGEVNFVTAEDVKRIRGFPKLSRLPSVGSDWAFLVGASIGTRESDKERLEHLVQVGLMWWLRQLSGKFYY